MAMALALHPVPLVRGRCMPSSRIGPTIRNGRTSPHIGDERLISNGIGASDTGPIGDHRLCLAARRADQTDFMVRIVKIVVPLAMLGAARRYFRDWGATKDESRQQFPGDHLVNAPAVQMTEAVGVDVPPSAVWPWLVQIGLGRGGLYLSEGLGDLLGLNFRNARRIHPKWQQIAVGDAIPVTPKHWMGRSDGVALTVAEMVPNHHLVLQTAHSGPPLAVWSFLVLPRGDNHSRLLIRVRAALRHPGAVAGMELIRPAAALATRAVLRGIKQRAERPHLLLAPG